MKQVNTFLDTTLRKLAEGHGEKLKNTPSYMAVDYYPYKRSDKFWLIKLIFNTLRLNTLIKENIMMMLQWCKAIFGLLSLALPLVKIGYK